MRKLIFLAFLQTTVLLLLPSQLRSEGLETHGGQALTLSGMPSRAVGTTSVRGWLGGFRLGYGYFVTDYFEPEVQGYIDFGDLKGTSMIAGGVLAGVNLYYNRFTRFLPYGGLRLGIGVLHNDIRGPETLNTTFTLAPHAGFLYLIREWFSLSVSVEYRHVFVPAQSVPDLNIVSLPVGISFLF